MKFLFITAQFYPSLGGVQTHSLEVARRLVKRGHEVVVITEADEVENESESEADRVENKPVSEIDGISVHRIYFGKSGKLKKFRIWKRMVQSDIRILVQKADVVVCHDVFIWYAPLRILYPRTFVMTVFHGYETKFPPSRMSVVIRRVSNWLSHRSIHVGNYIAKWYGTRADATLLTSGLRQTATAVQTGILSPAEAEAYAQQNEASSPRHILLIGRLSDDMGMKTYLQAFERMKKQQFHFTLEVCGDGPYRSELEKYGTVHGNVSHPIDYMKRADIVCASGYLSLLEALSFDKKCCAVYENELKKDYLTDSFARDWVFISDDAQKVAQFLMQPIETRSPTDRTYLQAELQKHSWDAITDTYLHLCKQK